MSEQIHRSGKIFRNCGEYIQPQRPELKQNNLQFFSFLTYGEKMDSCKATFNKLIYRHGKVLKPTLINMVPLAI